MAIEWIINDGLLSERNITLAGGGFRTQGVSYALLDTPADFDAAGEFTYDEYVILSRREDGVTKKFFQGRIRPITRTANPAYEGHQYAIEDAWSELERTIYQEKWWTKVGPDLVEKWAPRAVLAIKGQLIGAAITKIVTYAAGAGVSIQMGDCPVGEQLFSSEAINASCAEVLRECLKHHPDWVPWLDHSTTPPTLHIHDVAGEEVGESNHTLRTAASPADFVDTISDIEITKREDLLPQGVVLVYELAMTYEDEVYRQLIMDKYPEDCPESGPNIVTAFLPLEGMSMQIQKSRVKTRTIPIGLNDPSDSVVKKFLKRKYLHLHGIPDDKFFVASFTRELIEEETDPSEEVDPTSDFPCDPRPLSPQAKRLKAATVDDLPRELVEGQIEDWMRRKVGKVRITATIVPMGATTEQEKLINARRTPVTVVATNATTKLYKGISQWLPGEDVPTGIAESTYNAIHRSMHHEGYIELSMGDVPDTRYHGTVLNLWGADVEYQTMRAPVHSVDWDIETGKVVISFGPVPELAPADFLEMARMIRARPVRWWSVEERESAEFGASNHASAAGDTVTGFHQPETQYEGLGIDLSPCPFGRIEVVDGETVILGGPIKLGPTNLSAANRPINLAGDGSWLVYIEVDGISFNISDDEKFVLPGISGCTGSPTWATASVGGDYPADLLPSTPTDTGVVVLPVGVLTVLDGTATLQATGCGPFEVSQCAGNFTIVPRA